MRILQAGLIGLASLVAFGSAMAGGGVFSISLDRRYPTAYCPIDNDTFNLTFTAESSRAKIRIQGNNQSGTGSWLQQRFDNMVVVPKSVFDAHRLVTPGFAACFLAPGPANYPGYDF